MHRKEISAIDGPLFPAMVQNHRHYGNDLHQHFKLAQVAGLDRETLGGRNRTQSAHQKFAANDDHRDPRRNHAGIELHQGDERGGDQKLVRQRIKQHPDRSNLPTLARKVSVNAVSNRGRYKQSRRQQLFLSAHALKTVGGKNPDQQRNAANAGERDGIGKVHEKHRRPPLAASAETTNTELSSTTKSESNETKSGAAAKSPQKFNRPRPRAYFCLAMIRSLILS